MLKILRTNLLFLAGFIAAIGSAQVQPSSGARVIENQVQSRFDRETGGSAGSVWKQPWRIVILFNSSNAASNSSYTDLAVTTIRDFLTDRLGDGEPHKVWFYPYQLDLYSKESDCVEGQILSEKVLNQIESRIPRVPFDHLNDGSTAYPQKGGHSNINARKLALPRVPHGPEPLLLIQITDTAIGESPGSKFDQVIRQEDQRTGGLEGSGIVSWNAVPSLSTSRPNQVLNLFLYGSDPIHVPAHFPPRWLLIVLELLAAAIAAYLVWKLLQARGSSPSKAGAKPSFPWSAPAASWSVTIPGNGAIVLGKGERLSVFGPGSTPPPSTNFAFLRRDGAPSALLFELVWTQKGVQAVDGVWTLRAATSTGAPLISDSIDVNCTDKTTNSTHRFKIDIAAINKI